MKLFKKINTVFIFSVAFWLLFNNFYVLGQVQDSLINYPYIFYSAKPLGNITFLDESNKIRSFGDKIILLDVHNLPQDTLNIESVKGYNLIQSVLRLDSKSFSVSTNQLSYLIKVDSNKLKLVRQYSRGQIRKLVGSHHFAVLTSDNIIVFNSKKRRDRIDNECFIIDQNEKLLKKLKYSEKEEDVFKPNFIYPHHIQFRKGSLAFTSQSNNSYFMIDLKALKIDELQLLPFRSTTVSQMISYDFNHDQNYLIRIGENNSVDILNWDVNDNTYKKINATYYPIHKIRCGINDRQISFIGDFDDQTAWYLVPLKNINEFNN